MLKRLLSIVVFSAIALSVVFSALRSTLGASAYEARTSDAAGVRIVVTPKEFTPGQPTWDFEIVMDTHAKPLTEDLVRVSVLVDSAYRRVAPTAWEGDGPGGHHRKGVLKFPRPAEVPHVFELRIEAIGGAARTFRWEAK